MLIRTRSAVYAAEGTGASGSQGTGETKPGSESDSGEGEGEKGAAKGGDGDAGEVKADDTKPGEAKPSDALPATLEEAIAQIATLKAAGGTVPKWATDRIDTLTRSWRETERERDALNTQIRQLREAKPGQSTGLSVEDVQKQARVLAAAEAFNDATGKVLAAGRKEFADFDTSVQQLHNISPMMVQTAQGAIPSMPTPFIEALLELDAPTKVIAALAKTQNNDEAARIMSLPPAKQGVALAKFAASISETPLVSRTPAPPATEVRGRARAEPSLYDAGTDKISKEEWMELRTKQVNERATRRRA